MIQDNERNIYFQSHSSQDPIGILLRSHGLQASVLRSSVSNPQVMAGFPEYSNETMADKSGGRLIRKLVSLSMSAVRLPDCGRAKQALTLYQRVRTPSVPLFDQLETSVKHPEAFGKKAAATCACDHNVVGSFRRKKAFVLQWLSCSHTRPYN